MLNVDCVVKDGKLICTVDLAKSPLTPSASGKTLIVASTQGNQKIAGAGDKFAGLTVGLNAYISNQPK